MLSAICACLLLLVLCQRARPMTIEERVDAWQAERDAWNFRKAGR
jgi:hypothetical protein